ncbi:MAG TPA: hypothetical protein VHW24_23655 [Bryobacteraceae bacterium]|nr:hypothetical protein [Bryobacteraceae bacterium]
MGKLVDARELLAASFTRDQVAFNHIPPPGAAEAVELKRIL